MLEMVVTIEYRRVIRLAPYEPVSISIREDFTGAVVDYEKEYQGLKAQVDKWCEEVYEELGLKE